MLPKTGRSSPQHKPILLCKYLLPTFIFPLYSFQRHIDIIVTTLDNIGNVKGRTSGGGCLGCLCWRQSNSLVSRPTCCLLRRLRLKILLLLLISKHKMICSTFVQKFPDVFLQFYDIIHPRLASHPIRKEFKFNI